MVHGDKKKDERTSLIGGGTESKDGHAPVKRPLLGELKTEEEARLAAEIEKLRR